MNNNSNSSLPDNGNATLRDILARCGRLSVPVDRLAPDDDLFVAGLDSMAVVNVMLAMEEAFDLEIPETMLTRRAFSSLAAMERLVEEALAVHPG